MFKYGLVCILFCASLIAEHSIVFGQHTDTEAHKLDEAVHRLFQPLIDKGRAVGAAVGIVDGEREYSYYFGESVRKSGIKPDAHTGFEIASIGKTFAATMLADMHRKGELQLSDPIADYLPEGVRIPAYQGQRITFLHLANHTSGLPRLAPDHFDFPDFDESDPYRHYSTERLLNFLSAYEPEAAPGSREEYSNLGYGLLSYVFTVLTGKSYATLLQERVLQALGMRHSFYGAAEAPVTYADVYDHNLEQAGMWHIPDHLGGMAGLKATLPDMMCYLKANMGLQDNNPLAAAMQLAHTPTFSANAPFHTGLAWIITEQGDGTNIVWHNGGTAGSATLIAFSKEKNIGVVILFNTAVRGATGTDMVDMEMLAGILAALEQS